MGFDRDHVLLELRRFASYFYESYAASAGKPRWLDKSPEYVWHLEWLRTLFPDARFILLTRYALDQVDSHVSSQHDTQARLQLFRRTANEDTRITGTRYWAAAVRAQLEFARRHPSVTTWVRYEDVCVDPRAALTPILDFVGSAWSDEILEFGRKRHDFGNADSRARTSQSIALRTGAYMDWPEDIRRTCLELAEPELTSVGWTNNVQPESLL